MGKRSVSFALGLNSCLYPKAKMMCICLRAQGFPNTRGSRNKLEKTFASFCKQVALLFKCKRRALHVLTRGQKR